MTNPWLRKNPLLSLWLSAANSVMAAARGQGAAALGRQRAAAVRQVVGKAAPRKRTRKGR